MFLSISRTPSRKISPMREKKIMLRKLLGLKPKEPTEASILCDSLINDLDDWVEIYHEGYIFSLESVSRDITCKLRYISASEYDFYDCYITTGGFTAINSLKGVAKAMLKARKLHRKREQAVATEKLKKVISGD